MRAAILAVALLGCAGVPSAVPAQRVPVPPPSVPPAVEPVQSPETYSRAQRTGRSVGMALGLVAGGLIGWAVLPDPGEAGLGYVTAPALVALSAGAGAVAGHYLGLMVGTVVDDEGRPRTSVALVVGGVP